MNRRAFRDLRRHGFHDFLTGPDLHGNIADHRPKFFGELVAFPRPEILVRAAVVPDQRRAFLLDQAPGHGFLVQAEDPADLVLPGVADSVVHFSPLPGTRQTTARAMLGDQPEMRVAEEGVQIVRGAATDEGEVPPGPGGAGVQEGQQFLVRLRGGGIFFESAQGAIVIEEPAHLCAILGGLRQFFGEFRKGGTGRFW